MSKTLNVTLTRKYEYGFLVEDSVTCNDEEDFESFYAYDLTDCPEDATLYRDLFNGNNYIEAIRFGMELAARGYTDINVTTIKENE